MNPVQRLITLQNSVIVIQKSIRPIPEKDDVTRYDRSEDQVIQ